LWLIETGIGIEIVISGRNPISISIAIWMGFGKIDDVLQRISFERD